MRDAPANPFNWSGRPRHVLPREHEVREVGEALLAGEAVALLAGRGGGKSLFLDLLRVWLAANSGVRVVHFVSPPADSTIAASLRALARQLGLAPEVVSEHPGLDASELLEIARRGHPDERLVLLYDEVDNYVSGGEAYGKRLFANLEAARKRWSPDVGVLAAGAVGVFLLHDVLGSDFLTRARYFELPPFDDADVRALAAPFDAWGGPLPDEVRTTIRLLTGGNPALTAWLLQRLWDRHVAGIGVDPGTVQAEIALFRERHPGFISAFYRSLGRTEGVTAPDRVWARVRDGGPLPRRELEQLCGGSRPPMEVEDALRLLRATGLIRIAGSLSSDPVVAELVPSIFNLSDGRPGEPSLREQLDADLQRILSRVHRWGGDFFQGAGAQRRVVPESVWSAVVGVGLQEAGWAVSREALQGAGRTDLRVEHPGHTGHGVVELKIVGRHDEQVRSQILGYVAEGTEALTVVLLAENGTAARADAWRQGQGQGGAAMNARGALLQWEASGEAGGRAVAVRFVWVAIGRR